MATSNGELLEYRDRTTPRTTEGNRIYTATVHPADQTISPHNEGTYWIRWAMKLYFCCLKAPHRGGETPLADGVQKFCSWYLEEKAQGRVA